jgi:hypothetical protein
MNLQLQMLAAEIQKSDLSTEAITALIEKRLPKLTPPSFDLDDIKALLLQIGESQPEKFAIGLTEYIDNCCACSEEGNEMDLEIFKEYVKDYKDDQE